MDKARWDKLQSLFGEALELPPPQRLKFLEENAGGDEALVYEVVAMLERDNQPSFLDRGVETVAGKVLDEPSLTTFETVGPYRLHSQLGAGGMGVVYLAERQDWQVKVALKIPRDVWISSDRLRRFADEQRLLARLVHPAIARIYEAGTLAQGTPWFAMEHVDGEPITKYCQSRGVSVRERLQLFVKVCEAVQYAHTQAIIHRDLKPSNLFVTRTGDVKLLDFGIAKQIEDSVNAATATVLGQQPVTLAYAAPEQVISNHFSTQTDVYSLGVILYELLTGRLPFDFSDRTPAQAEEIIRTHDPEKPSTVEQKTRTHSPEVMALRGPSKSEWSDLNVLVLTAMHKDVAKRYGSVDALRRDVVHFLKSEPLEARADTLTYRARKFLRRRRAPVLLAAAMLALLAAVITFYTIKLTKARDAALVETARTRLARQFTTELLEGGDSEVGPSKDLRVIDLADRGLAKANALKGDPVQQGELFSTIGSLYQSLGEYSKAEPVLQSSYKILAAAIPTSHETAEAAMHLGLLYSDLAENKKAEDWLRKSIAIEEQVTPPDGKLLLLSRFGLASVLVRSRPEDALPLLRDAEKDPAAKENEESLATIWNLIGTSLINLGRFDEAEPYARKELSYERKIKPPNNPDITNELLNLGRIEFDRGHYAESERYRREALASDEAFYGEGHPEIASAKRQLAETLFQENKLEEATTLATESLAELKKIYGGVHPRVAFTLQMLGRLAMKRGALPEAEADFKEEVAILRAVDDHMTLPMALAYLGTAYSKEGRYGQSAQSYRDALDAFAKSPGANSARVEQVKQQLAKVSALEKQPSNGTRH